MKDTFQPDPKPTDLATMKEYFKMYNIHHFDKPATFPPKLVLSDMEKQEIS